MVFFFPIVIVAIFASLVIQEFVAPIEWLNGARLMIMPVLMFYGALAFPYPLTLLMVFLGGLMWDLVIFQIVGGPVEFSLGWSILLYALLCSFVHGFRPLFLRGRWEIHCLLSGFGTSLMILAEYLMITFRREGIVFNDIVWWRILGSGFLAMLLAPVVFVLFNGMARLVGVSFAQKDANTFGGDET